MRPFVIFALIVSGALAVLAGLSFLEYSGNWDPEYGIVQLDAGGSRSVYLKRDIRGILGNHDRTGITMNPVRCEDLDETRDYMVRDEGYGVVYRWEGDILHLYQGEDEPRVPPRPNGFPITIVRHEDVNWSPFHARDDLPKMGYRLVVVDPFDFPPCESVWDILFGPRSR